MRAALVAVTVGIIALAAYAATMLPDLGWDDTPELALAVECHGIPHSPGFPLFVLLGRVVKLIFGGTGARAATWVSALAGAGAAGLLAGILTARAGTVLGLAGGFTLAASPLAWLQGTHGEVYTLQTLLTIMLVVAATSPPSSRTAAGAGYVFGLAMVNHPSAIAFAPLLIPLARARCWPLAGGTALALTVIVTLPLRSLQAPCLDWGITRTIQGFLWLATLREFQPDALSGRLLAGGSVTGALDCLRSFLTTSLPPAILGLSAVTLPLAIRHTPLLFLSFGVLATAALAAGGGPDTFGYLLPLCPSLIGAAIIGIRVLRFPARAASIALCLAAMLHLAPRLPGLDRSFDRSACDYRDVLASQLDGRILFTDSSTDLFLMLHYAWSRHSQPSVAYTPYLGIDWYRSTLNPSLVAALPKQPDPPYAAIARAAEGAGLQPVFSFSRLPQGARGILIPEGWLALQGPYAEDADRAALKRWENPPRPVSQGGRHRALRMAQGGQLLAAAALHEPATRRFAEALQADPANRAIWQSMIASLARLGRCGELGLAARSHIRCGPLPISGAELLVSAMEAVRGPCPDATAMSESLAAMFPSSTPLAAGAARRALADAEPVRALRILAPHTTTPSADLSNLRGVSLMLTGSYDQALASFADAMSLSDSSIRRHLAANMAVCLHRLGRYAEADSLVASLPRSEAPQ